MNDDRDDYYKRKEAKQYTGGAGVIRILVGGFLFFATIFSKEDLMLWEHILISSISIVFLTFGIKAYINAIKSGFKS